MKILRWDGMTTGKSADTSSAQSENKNKWPFLPLSSVEEIRRGPREEGERENGRKTTWHGGEEIRYGID